LTAPQSKYKSLLRYEPIQPWPAQAGLGVIVQKVAVKYHHEYRTV
jgi:hypothetical protein